MSVANARLMGSNSAWRLYLEHTDVELLRLFEEELRPAGSWDRINGGVYGVEWTKTEIINDASNVL